MADLDPGKYARPERERRFLLAVPPATGPVVTRRITDRYLTGTRMRLRAMELPGAEPVFKLTQKIPAERPGPVQGLITTVYLSAAEYEVFAALPARVLRKVRHSVPPLGVDVFGPPLDGLVLAEAEFDSDEEATAFAVPSLAVAEVTADPRFTGGRLAAATPSELREWLAGFGIAPP
ncbi:CYTH domain-containing protein [Actinacidiphila rubida]|uniref:CYTH domain-containing protein n=1 Tax=Actinacidiphila rubida TaxID=310780 RepID=A0A1H8TZV0_9ACTN|nr:hypothetical protein [Actinacidiphila rubida]SEO96326.1 hypothetical protein SAMN05216267_106121 [Actinacidiphila rubida]